MNPRQQSGEAKKESKGFRKVWGQIKTAFKDKDAGSSSSSVVDSEAPALASSTKVTSRQTAAEVPVATLQPTSKIVESSAEKRPHDEEADVRLQKLKASLAKYDYLLNEDDEDVPITISDYRAVRDAPYERVHKNIRMRVKYTCHQCRTTYGSVKQKGKKETDHQEEDALGHVGRGIGYADARHGTEPHCACHECRTGFELGAAECPNCHHQICSLCLKKPELTIAIESEALSAADTDWKESERAGAKPPPGADRTSAPAS
ncbi:hypothetical protein DV735_g115, partial [Chaetothyriales sp. CBS 134920]